MRGNDFFFLEEYLFNAYRNPTNHVEPNYILNKTFYSPSLSSITWSIHGQTAYRCTTVRCNDRPEKAASPKRPKEICCRRFAKGICALVCTSFRSLSRGCHLHLVPVTSPINTTARRARPNSPPLPADLRPGYRKHYDCCDIC